MKRRTVSIILILSMVLAMLPVPVWAAETDPAETAAPFDAEEAPETGAEAATPSGAEETTETAVEEVQALIDALPAAEEVRATDKDGQRAAYDRTQAAYDAYMALSEKQRGLVAGAGVFEKLFAFFNGQTMLLADSSFGGGNGTSTSPYLIYNRADLVQLATDVNGGNTYSGKYFKLMNNINLGGSSNGSWTPIGNSYRFQGVFDGDGYEIQNLYINQPDGSSLGLFGGIGDGGTVRNLGVTGTVVARGGGGIAGVVYEGGTIENCCNAANVTNTKDTNDADQGLVGGIAGQNYGTITNCYNTGTITCNYRSGGIAGQNYGIIKNCYNIGTVQKYTGSYYNYVSGIVGANDTSANDAVTNCYYLSSKNNQGTGSWPGDTTGVTDEEFASGKVAWLLQNGQSTQIWGQSVLSNPKDSYPILTSVPEKKVLRVRFQHTSAVLQTNYTNSGGKVTPPAISTSVQAKWQADGSEFTANTTITKDTEVFFKLPLNGEGTASKPYEIGTLGELELFRDYINVVTANGKGEYFKLTANIDLSSTYSASKNTSWTPIGASTNAGGGFQGTPFSGTFDGNGRKIIGLYINKPNENYQGLFGQVNGGTVKNLGIENGSVTGRQYVGGVVGANEYSARVENCYNTAEITATNSESQEGGIVGVNAHQSTVINCYNQGAVNGKGRVGGVVGQLDDSSAVDGCYNTGPVTGSNDVGGIAGLNYRSTSTITNSYYLNGYGTTDYGTSKTDAEFVSGEVARLLQDSQTDQATQVWGQLLSGSVRDAAPVLTSDSAKKVLKVTFATTANSSYAVKYTNPNCPVDLPADPSAGTGYAFYGWSTNQTSRNFTAQTLVSADITVYALVQETFGGETGEITVTAIYGYASELTSNLYDYIAYEVHGKNQANGNFDFGFATNNTIGAQISGGTLTVPTGLNAGTYNLTVTATEKQPQISPLAVGGYGTGTVTLNVKVTIGKAALNKNMFNFIEPSNLTYDSTSKEATVTIADSYKNKGVGGITVKYYKDNVLLNTKPTDAGDYTVKIDVAEGQNYNGTTDLTDSSWKFTVYKADSTVTPSAKQTIIYGEELELTATAAIRTLAAQDTMEFVVNDTNRFTENVSGSTAAKTVAVTAANGFIIGDNTITVNYGGSANLNGSNNNTITVFVTSKPLDTPGIIDNPTKLYDGTANGTVALSFDTLDTVSGDNVRISYDSYTYNGINAGAHTVTATGVRLEGEQAGYYTLDNNTATGTGTIEQATLTPRVVSVNSKTYDGNTDAGGTISLSGAVLNEEPTATSIFRFSDKSAGQNKNVNVNVILNGDWGKNYKLSTSSLNATANIAKLPAQFTWDYTEPFTFKEGERHTVTATLENKVAGDTVTLSYTDNQKSAVGSYTAKITLNGTDGDNYTLEGGTNTELFWEINKAGQPTPNVGIDYIAESLTYTDAEMQYHTGNGNWKYCTGDMTLESISWSGAAMTAYFRYPEHDNYVESTTQPLDIPDRPPPPSDIEITKTQTSITLNSAGAEFLKNDNTSWQSSGIFDNLTAGTEYTIYVRTKATAEHFLSYHAVVTVTTVNSDGSTTLKPGETVGTEGGGTITNHGDDVTLDDGKGNTAAVTPPEGEDFSGGVEVDGDGNVTVPGGSTVTPPGGPDITVGEQGGTLDEDGNITLPGGGAQVGDNAVTVPEGGGTLEPDGKGGVEVPGGSTVTPPGGPDITVGEQGGTLDKDGNITLPGGGAQVGDTAVTVPEDGGTLEPDGKGGVEVPGGSTVTPPGGPDITVGPGNRGAVDKDGNVTLPGGGSAKIGDTTVTVPETGGTLTPNGDGSVNVPPGSKVKDKDGTEHTVPSQGGTIGSDGVYKDNPSSGGGGGGGASLPTYPPVIPKTEGGKVSVSPSNPRWGSTVTITPAPDEGYEVGDVSVKDSRGNALKVKDNGNGAFSYTQPIGKVTIEVTFKAVSLPPSDEPNFPAPAFSDLDPGAWYREAVDYVISRGLMSGYGDGTFGPDDTLSRAMLAQILYNAAGGVPVNYLIQYDDVPAGAWHTEAVRWAASEGIVSGYGNGVFGTNDPITREQLAAMLYRFWQLEFGVTEARIPQPACPDAAEISDWAYDAMGWFAMNGILSGYEDGTLRPQGQATRAEAASMLMRFLSLPAET